MDNLKIGIRVLGPIAASTVIFASSGCTNAPTSFVPSRSGVSASLVAGATAEFNARNDDTLGTERDAIMRVSESATIRTYDRQQIVNGRPYNDYDTITRARERFAR